MHRYVLRWPDQQAIKSTTMTAFHLMAESGSSEEEGSELHYPYSAENGFLFLMVAIATGCVLRYLFQRYKLYVPYTIVILIVGLLFGLVQMAADNPFTASEVIYSQLDPNLLLIIFIPPLLYSSAFNIRFHVIWRSLFSSILMAFPGVGLITVILAITAYFCFTEYSWSWPFAFLFASILGSTDPVAVVSILRDVGGPTILSTIIEGESLLNDGSSYVLFLIFRDLALGHSTSNAGDSVALFFQIALGGPCWGYVMGVCTIWFLKHVHNDIETEITTTIVAAYFAFFVADAYLNVSSYLSVVCLALYMSKYKHSISPEVHTSLKHVWKVISFIAETLIFLLSGIIVSERIFIHGGVTAIDVGYLFLTYAMIQVSRAIATTMMVPFMKISGIHLDWRETLVLVWSGLRGAVCLALALLTYLTPGVAPADADRIIFLVGGNVFLTLVINGTSIQFIVKRLQLHVGTPGSRLVLAQAIKYMRNKTHDKLAELKKARQFDTVDYKTVTGFLPQQIHDPKAKEETAKPQGEANTDDINVNQDATTIAVAQLRRGYSTGNQSDDRSFIKEEISRRFLAAMLADYNVQYSKGLVTRDTLSYLIEANESASDVGNLRFQWESINNRFRIPWWLRQLYTNRVIRSFTLGRQFVTKLMFQHLAISMELATSFLAAKVRIEQLLREFPEFSALDQEVVDEVKAEAGSFQRKAFKAWLDVQQSYPQAYSAVQTRHACKIMLHHAAKEAKQLFSTAMLEPSEYRLLHAAIDKNLFQLDRTKFKPTLRSSKEILASLPLFANLPPELRKHVLSQGRMKLLQHGDVLLERGQPTPGMYVIVRGIITVRYDVQWLNDVADAITGQKQGNNDGNEEAANEHRNASTMSTGTWHDGTYADFRNMHGGGGSHANTLNGNLNSWRPSQLFQTVNGNKHGHKHEHDDRHGRKLDISTADYGSIQTFRYADGTAKRVRKEKLTAGSLLGAYDALTSYGSLASARAQTVAQLYFFDRSVVSELVNQPDLGDVLFRSMAEALFKSKFYTYLRRKQLSFMHAHELAVRARFVRLKDEPLVVKPGEHVLVLTGSVTRHTTTLSPQNRKDKEFVEKHGTGATETIHVGDEQAQKYQDQADEQEMRVRRKSHPSPTGLGTTYQNTSSQAIESTQLDYNTGTTNSGNSTAPSDSHVIQMPNSNTDDEARSPPSPNNTQRTTSDNHGNAADGGADDLTVDVADNDATIECKDEQTEDIDATAGNEMDIGDMQLTETNDDDPLHTCAPSCNDDCELLKKPKRASKASPSPRKDAISPDSSRRPANNRSPGAATARNNNSSTTATSAVDTQDVILLDSAGQGSPPSPPSSLDSVRPPALALDDELTNTTQTEEPMVGPRATSGVTTPKDATLFNADDEDWDNDISIHGTLTIVQAPCLLHSNSPSEPSRYQMHGLTRLLVWTDKDEIAVKETPIEPIRTLDDEAKHHGYDLALVKHMREDQRNQLDEMFRSNRNTGFNSLRMRNALATYNANGNDYSVNSNNNHTLTNGNNAPRHRTPPQVDRRRSMPAGVRPPVPTRGSGKNANDADTSGGTGTVAQLSPNRTSAHAAAYGSTFGTMFRQAKQRRQSVDDSDIGRHSAGLAGHDSVLPTNLPDIKPTYASDVKAKKPKRPALLPSLPSNMFSDPSQPDPQSGKSDHSNSNTPRRNLSSTNLERQSSEGHPSRYGSGRIFKM